MPIRPFNRAQGYIKGHQGVDLRLEVGPDEAYISDETGRATVPTKTVDLETLKKYRDTFVHPLHMSDVVPQGTVVIVDHGALPYHYGAYLHPTDYYWLKHQNNPELAHKLVMSWIDQRIENMGKAAEVRLDKMVEEMEQKADYKAVWNKYKGGVKYYHDMSHMGVAFDPFFAVNRVNNPFAVGGVFHDVAFDEVLMGHVSHKEDSLKHAIASLNLYRGYPDDWHLTHPRTVELKTVTDRLLRKKKS